MYSVHTQRCACMSHTHTHTHTHTHLQVLAGHTKAEVFDMVKDLDLPLEHGDTHLLKKLQALGLHSNRSEGGRGREAE